MTIELEKIVCAGCGGNPGGNTCRFCGNELIPQEEANVNNASSEYWKFVSSGEVQTSSGEVLRVKMANVKELVDVGLAKTSGDCVYLPTSFQGSRLAPVLRAPKAVAKNQSGYIVSSEQEVYPNVNQTYENEGWWVTAPVAVASVILAGMVSIGIVDENVCGALPVSSLALLALGSNTLLSHERNNERRRLGEMVREKSDDDMAMLFEVPSDVGWDKVFAQYLSSNT